MPTEQEVIKNLNRFRPPFLDDLGCTITVADADRRICEMQFEIGPRYCHSGDIIQGGFVTAMLDAVCTHAVFAADPKVTTVATLELKVTFYGASRQGVNRAVGRVDKMTRNFAFLSGDLFDEAGQRTASITTTAKISTS